ncbi:hypothetical protein LTH96_12155 [Nesterenkonia sp. LB17]|uniref:ApeA N-terminal domain 1-containing protein n=1 Tax=Nesterenkonia sp. LB17 TaxID=2901230 RepID=UPI001F4CA487|nr:HEPN domain-containing protein [Nesterenkonia sp. LB17]MCH8566468.1 hypothetical protein [Nesterenkonia sp. LB17]
MSDEQRIKGWWHLPSANDTRVPGILTWSQDGGAELELIGGFSTNAKYEQAAEKSWTAAETWDRSSQRGTIYGETVAGKLITLWEAELGNYTTDVNNQPLEQFWRSSWLCVGAQLPSPEEPVFQSVTVVLDDLSYLTGDGRFSPPRWIRMEGVDTPGEQTEDGSELMPYALPVIGGRRAAWASGSTEDATYFIDTFATRPFVSPATEMMPNLKLDLMMRRTRTGRRVELSEGARVRINPTGSAFKAVDVPSRISPLLELLRLATFGSSAVTSMSAITGDGHEVSLLCRLGQHSAPDARTQNDRMVFTFDDVSLESYLEAWQRLGSKPQGRYAWNLAVGLIGHSPKLVEEHISQVLAAAEGLHRWCLSGSRNTKLEDRLIDLHGRLPESLRTGLDLDAGKWADWAVWMRNHVDHGGAEKHREVGDFYHLKVIADCVRLVTYLGLLTELGIPVKKMEEALLNHPRISVLRERCQELGALPDSQKP